MVDKNKLLDEVMRREKKPKIKRWLLYIALAIIFGSVYSYSVFKNYDRVKFSKQLSGVVEEVKTSITADNKSQSVFVIKLENEKLIEIPAIKLAKFKQGDKVKVVRQELESGRLRYSIVLK